MDASMFDFQISVSVLDVCWCIIYGQLLPFLFFWLMGALYWMEYGSLSIEEFTFLMKTVYYLGQPGLWSCNEVIVKYIGAYVILGSSFHVEGRVNHVLIEMKENILDIFMGIVRSRFVVAIK